MIWSDATDHCRQLAFFIWIPLNSQYRLQQAATPDPTSLYFKKVHQRPLLSAVGCHTRQDGQHCPLRTYHDVFFKGREILWGQNTIFIFDECNKRVNRRDTAVHAFKIHAFYESTYLLSQQENNIKGELFRVGGSIHPPTPSAIIAKWATSLVSLLVFLLSVVGFPMY